jgi:uncharacterized protein (TIGR03435 family)
MLTGNGLTMNNLASGLAVHVRGVDRLVVDRTGLSGTFDVDLRWNFEGTAEHLGVPLPPPDRSQPSLFTALQEQLGLKLESTKGPVDVLVIDHVEPLRENPPRRLRTSRISVSAESPASAAGFACVEPRTRSV